MASFHAAAFARVMVFALQVGSPRLGFVLGGCSSGFWPAATVTAYYAVVGVGPLLTSAILFEVLADGEDDTTRPWSLRRVAAAAPCVSHLLKVLLQQPPTGGLGWFLAPVSSAVLVASNQEPHDATAVQASALLILSLAAATVDFARQTRQLLGSWPAIAVPGGDSGDGGFTAALRAVETQLICRTVILTLTHIALAVLAPWTFRPRQPNSKALVPRKDHHGFASLPKHASSRRTLDGRLLEEAWPPASGQVYRATGCIPQPLMSSGTTTEASGREPYSCPTGEALRSASPWGPMNGSITGALPSASTSYAVRPQQQADYDVRCSLERLTQQQPAQQQPAQRETQPRQQGQQPQEGDDDAGPLGVGHHGPLRGRSLGPSCCAECWRVVLSRCVDAAMLTYGFLCGSWCSSTAAPALACFGLGGRPWELRAGGLPPPPSLIRTWGGQPAVTASAATAASLEIVWQMRGLVALLVTSWGATMLVLDALWALWPRARRPSFAGVIHSVASWLGGLSRAVLVLLLSEGATSMQDAAVVAGGGGGGGGALDAHSCTASLRGQPAVAAAALLLADLLASNLSPTVCSVQSGAAVAAAALLHSRLEPSAEPAALAAVYGTMWLAAAALSYTLASVSVSWQPPGCLPLGRVVLAAAGGRQASKAWVAEAAGRAGEAGARETGNARTSEVEAAPRRARADPAQAVASAAHASAMAAASLEGEQLQAVFGPDASASAVRRIPPLLLAQALASALSNSLDSSCPGDCSTMQTYAPDSSLHVLSLASSPKASTPGVPRRSPSPGGGGGGEIGFASPAEGYLRVCGSWPLPAGEQLSRGPLPPPATPRPALSQNCSLDSSLGTNPHPVRHRPAVSVDALGPQGSMVPVVEAVAADFAACDGVGSAQRAFSVTSRLLQPPSPLVPKLSRHGKEAAAATAAAAAAASLEAMSQMRRAASEHSRPPEAPPAGLPYSYSEFAGKPEKAQSPPAWQDGTTGLGPWAAVAAAAIGPGSGVRAGPLDGPVLPKRATAAGVPTGAAASAAPAAAAPRVVLRGAGDGGGGGISGIDEDGLPWLWAPSRHAPSTAAWSTAQQPRVLTAGAPPPPVAPLAMASASLRTASDVAAGSASTSIMNGQAALSSVVLDADMYDRLLSSASSPFLLNPANTATGRLPSPAASLPPPGTAVASLSIEPRVLASYFPNSSGYSDTSWSTQAAGPGSGRPGTLKAASDAAFVAAAAAAVRIANLPDDGFQGMRSFESKHAQSLCADMAQEEEDEEAGLDTAGNASADGRRTSRVGPLSGRLPDVAEEAPRQIIVLADGRQVYQSETLAAATSSSRGLWSPGWGSLSRQQRWQGLNGPIPHQVAMPAPTQHGSYRALQRASGAAGNNLGRRSSPGLSAFAARTSEPPSPLEQYAPPSYAHSPTGSATPWEGRCGRYGSFNPPQSVALPASVRSESQPYSPNGPNSQRSAAAAAAFGLAARDRSLCSPPFAWGTGTGSRRSLCDARSGSGCAVTGPSSTAGSSAGALTGLPTSGVSYGAPDTAGSTSTGGGGPAAAPTLSTGFGFGSSGGGSGATSYNHASIDIGRHLHDTGLIRIGEDEALPGRDGVGSGAITNMETLYCTCIGDSVLEAYLAINYQDAGGNDVMTCPPSTASSPASISGGGASRIMLGPHRTTQASHDGDAAAASQAGGSSSSVMATEVTLAGSALGSGVAGLSLGSGVAGLSRACSPRESRGATAASLHCQAPSSHHHPGFKTAYVQSPAASTSASGSSTGLPATPAVSNGARDVSAAYLSFRPAGASAMRAEGFPTSDLAPQSLLHAHTAGSSSGALPQFSNTMPTVPSGGAAAAVMTVAVAATVNAAAGRDPYSCDSHRSSSDRSLVSFADVTLGAMLPPVPAAGGGAASVFSGAGGQFTGQHAVTAAVDASCASRLAGSAAALAWGKTLGGSSQSRSPQGGARPVGANDKPGSVAGLQAGQQKANTFASSDGKDGIGGYPAGGSSSGGGGFTAIAAPGSGSRETVCPQTLAPMVGSANRLLLTHAASAAASGPALTSTVASPCVGPAVPVSGGGGSNGRLPPPACLPGGEVRHGRQTDRPTLSKLLASNAVAAAATNAVLSSGSALLWAAPSSASVPFQVTGAAAVNGGAVGGPMSFAAVPPAGVFGNERQTSGHQYRYAEGAPRGRVYAPTGDALVSAEEALTSTLPSQRFWQVLDCQRRTASSWLGSLLKRGSTTGNGAGAGASIGALHLRASNSGGGGGGGMVIGYGHAPEASDGSDCTGGSGDRGASGDRGSSGAGRSRSSQPLPRVMDDTARLSRAKAVLCGLRRRLRGGVKGGGGAGI